MSLRRSITLTAATQLPTLILGFLSGVWITRLLGEEGRGGYSLLQANVILLSVLLSLNLNTGLVYYLAREKENRAEVLGVATSALILVAVLLFGVTAYAWFFGIPSNPFLPYPLNSFFFVAYLSFTIVFTLALSYFGGLFAGLRQFNVVNRMALITAGLNFCVYGGLFLFLDKGTTEEELKAVLCGAMSVLLLLFIIWLLHYIWLVGLTPIVFKGGPFLRRMFGFSLISYLSLVLNQLNYRLDFWFLQDYRGARELGLYAVGVGVAQVLFQVTEPLTQVLQPHLINRDDSDMLEKFKLYARLGFTLVFTGACVLAALAGWMIPLIYGEGFKDSVDAFRLLLPGIVLASGSKLMALLVFRTGKIYYNLYATAIGVCFTVGLNILLIPEIGLIGAAISSTVAYLVIFIIVLWAVFVQLHFPWGNYFILQRSDIAKLLRD
jgi:O-antigen/teichoic acid export membrane protein